MKYLAVVRGCNEPDNNTPSDVLWCKVVEIDNNLEQAKKTYEKEFEKDYEYGAEVSLYPLSELENKWTRIQEIW